jgi:molybdopterin/thiamine biosynthesis adenylyltransferase
MREPQIIRHIKRKLVLNDEDVRELAAYNRQRFYGQSGVRMAVAIVK